MSEAVKWALIDLLKVVDAAHGGRFHTELARIAQGLGIEIPPVDPVPDPPGGAFEERGSPRPLAKQDRRSAAEVIGWLLSGGPANTPLG